MQIKGKSRYFSIPNLSNTWAQITGTKQALNFITKIHRGKPTAKGLSSVKPRTLIAYKDEITSRKFNRNNMIAMRLMSLQEKVKEK